jgi:hypothetical protein
MVKVSLGVAGILWKPVGGSKRFWGPVRLCRYLS